MKPTLWQTKNRGNLNMMIVSIENLEQIQPGLFV